MTNYEPGARGRQQLSPAPSRNSNPHQRRRLQQQQPPGTSAITAPSNWICFNVPAFAEAFGFDPLAAAFGPAVAFASRGWGSLTCRRLPAVQKAAQTVTFCANFSSYNSTFDRPSFASAGPLLLAVWPSASARLSLLVPPPVCCIEQGCCFKKSPYQLSCQFN